MAEPHHDYRREDEDEEEEEEVDDTGYKAVKDAVLFAIEVSPSMLQVLAAADRKKGAGNSATSAALKCAYALMQQRIISNPKDMMGILLFGTKDTRFQDEEEHSKGQLQYPNCYILADLDIPAAADVKRLRSIIEDEEEAKRLLVACDQPVKMATVLFCANQIFTTKAPNFSSRRLFLVTDNDNPHAQEKDVKASAIVRAKDLYDLGVIIELFPISQPNHEFDRSKFYDDIVYRVDVTDPEAPAPLSKTTKPLQPKDGIALLNSLLSSISSKAMPRRTLISNIPFEFSPSLKITVKAFVIFKRQVPTRSCYIWLEGETPQIAIGATTQMAEDTARTVDKVEIRKAFRFGGETVTFTTEELSSLKNFGDPVIRILGFKPMSMLPAWANLKVATFLYPSEDEYIGSTRTFAALHQSLLKKQKMGLVWYIARKNAAPVLAALIPGAEKLDEGEEQVMPAGLWLIPLPWADDIRSNPEINSLIRAPDSLVDKMRLVMEQLQLPGGVYDPSKYPNPALQWHYRILQALALEEELPEQPDDKTIPRYRPIEKRAGPYIQDWKTELETQFRSWQLSSRSAPSKHSADDALGSAPKKPKVVVVPSNHDSLNDEEMKKHFEKNTVAKLTAAVLKSWLGSKGLSIVGKKADLVERTEAFFEAK